MLELIYRTRRGNLMNIAKINGTENSNFKTNQKTKLQRSISSPLLEKNSLNGKEVSFAGVNPQEVGLFRKGMRWIQKFCDSFAIPKSISGKIEDVLRRRDEIISAAEFLKIHAKTGFAQGKLVKDRSMSLVGTKLSKMRDPNITRTVFIFDGENFRMAQVFNEGTRGIFYFDSNGMLQSYTEIIEGTEHKAKETLTYKVPSGKILYQIGSENYTAVTRQHMSIQRGNKL